MITKTDIYDLSTQNTFGMKVSCACFIQYDKAEDLNDLDFQALPQPVLHIGSASNLLFTGDFKGTVLHSAIKYIKYIDMGLSEVLVAVGAGVLFDDFVAQTCGHGLWGAENLSLIPGETGAAAVQNIGAYGVEVKDIISGVVCYDTQTRTKCTFKVGDCNYDYRTSRFKEAPDKGRYIVTSVLFRLTRTYSPKLEYKGIKEALGGKEPKTPQEVRDAVIKIRMEKLPDPKVMGSAGSFFRVRKVKNRSSIKNTAVNASSRRSAHALPLPIPQSAASFAVKLRTIKFPFCGITLFAATSLCDKNARSASRSKTDPV